MDKGTCTSPSWGWCCWEDMGWPGDTMGPWDITWNSYVDREGILGYSIPYGSMQSQSCSGLDHLLCGVVSQARVRTCAGSFPANALEFWAKFHAVLSWWSAVSRHFPCYSPYLHLHVVVSVIWRSCSKSLSWSCSTSWVKMDSHVSKGAVTHKITAGSWCPIHTLDTLLTLVLEMWVTSHLAMWSIRSVSVTTSWHSSELQRQRKHVELWQLWNHPSSWVNLEISWTLIGLLQEVAFPCDTDLVQFNDFFEKHRNDGRHEIMDDFTKRTPLQDELGLEDRRPQVVGLQAFDSNTKNPLIPKNKMII